MNPQQIKRHSEKRRVSAYRLPSIYQEKHSVVSSKKKMPESYVLAELKGSSQHRSSNQKISTNSKKRISAKYVGPIPVSEKLNKKNSNSNRLRTQSPRTQLKNHSFQNISNAEESEQNDKTLQNFQKYIKRNREHIHSEINKRRKVLEKQQEYQNVQSQKFSAPGYIDIHKGKSVQMQRSNEKLLKKDNEKVAKAKTRSNTTCAEESTNSEVFGEIQKIINNKISSNDLRNHINMNQVEYSVKLAKLIHKIRKLSPEKSIHDIRVDLQLEKSMMAEKKDKSNMSTSRRVLKDQNNYHEWRRVDFLSDNLDEPNYKQSTFELENQRLEQFILKNQISLRKFLQSRKQLLQFKTNQLKVSIA